MFLLKTNIDSQKNKKLLQKSKFFLKNRKNLSEYYL